MRRSEVIETLRAHQAKLHAMGVETLYLFGSVARDEATSSSDVDLFFDYSNPGKFNFYDLVDVKDEIRRLLGTEVDVMSRRGLHRLMRPRVEKLAIRVF